MSPLHQKADCPSFLQLVHVLTALVMPLLFAACGSGGSSSSSSSTSTTVRVASISLNLGSASLSVGETIALTATVSPSNASNKAVTWASSNTAVATVSAAGLVTALSPGSTNLTATAQDGSGVSSSSCSITVVPQTSVAVTAITLNSSAMSLNTGGTTTLTATVSPSNASNKAVTWASSNTTVATVSTAGLVTALSTGSTNITATAKDGSGIVSNPCAVTVTSSNAITHGGQLNASNTGVPDGHTLADVSTTIVVTEAWITASNGGSRILENKNFLSGARIEIKTGNFTVRYCKFNGTSGGSVDYGLADVVFEYCEFDGQHLNTGGDCALGIGSLTARRLHIHRWPRAFWFGWSNVHIEECYIHDETADGGDAHIENIYVAGGANLTFIRNKLISNEVHINGDTRLMTSASLAIYNEDYSVGTPFPSFPSLDNIVVQDNYIETDGYYAMYCGACVGKTGAYAKNMSVTGNIFGRQLHRYCGRGGPAVCFDPSQIGNIWSNNTWGAPGPENVTGDPAEGDLIGAPTPN